MKRGMMKRARSVTTASKIVARPKSPPITKVRFLKALRGTGGVKKLIAERLGCSYTAIRECLLRPDWEDVRWALQDEIDQVADLAEQTVREAIQQRLDLSLATQTARWLLTRARYRDRQMGEESTVKVEGGEPIRLMRTNLSIEVLDLPLEVKRAILEAVERKQAELTGERNEQESLP